MLEEFKVGHLFEDKHLKQVKEETREILEESRKAGVIDRLNRQHLTAYVPSLFRERYLPVLKLLKEHDAKDIPELREKLFKTIGMPSPSPNIDIRELSRRITAIKENKLEKNKFQAKMFSTAVSRRQFDLEIERLKSEEAKRR
jgi:hypothetical protein